MKKHKNPARESRPIWYIALGLLGLGLLIAYLLRDADVALLNPKGYIAQQQLNLMLVSLVIMLVIAVPALFLFYFFAWKYRETNEKATYDPTGRQSKYFVFGIWAFPIIIAIVLAGVMWPATQKLEPTDNLAYVSDAEPVTIQVVAMRWKWLFIYPEQNIASVNFVQIPTNTPVKFELTADESPMSSFWIPHLSGQLYAMTGHANHLNILADTPGDYPGSSAEINGAGFAGMKFIARAGSQADFDRWVHDVQVATAELDSTQYQKLLKPTENHPAEFYALTESGLYDKVLMKYSGSHEHSAGEPGENKDAHSMSEKPKGHE